MSSAYSVSVHPGPAGGKSLVYIVYRVGDITLPWGTPLEKVMSELNAVPMSMLPILLSKKVQSVFNNISGSPRCANLYLTPECQTLSNALATSLKTTITWCLSAREFAIVSYVVAIAVVVLRFGLNPCCLSLMILLSSKKALNLDKISFSNNFPGVSSNETGL